MDQISVNMGLRVEQEGRRIIIEDNKKIYSTFLSKSIEYFRHSSLNF
jgi:hypothetical protein